MYLVRSRGRVIRLRDIGRKAKPMLEVGPVKWVAFVELPVGHGVGQDADLEIRESLDPAEEIDADELDLDPQPVSAKPKPPAVKLPPWKAAAVPTLAAFVETFEGKMSGKDIVRKLAPQGMVLDPKRETTLAMLERIHAAHAAMAGHMEPPADDAPPEEQPADEGEADPLETFLIENSELDKDAIAEKWPDLDHDKRMSHENMLRAVFEQLTAE